MQENHNNFIPNKELLIKCLIALIALILFILLYSRADTKKMRLVAVEEKSVVDRTRFEKLNLSAKSVYVYDILTKEIIFEKNSLAQLPLASLTKLMTALTAHDLLPEDSKITIKKEFLTTEGDNGLLVNESWKLKDLLDFSLVVSSNDAARSVASVIGALSLDTSDYELGRKEFVSLMNRKASEIGLSETYYINESGLDIDRYSGGYGTAKDVSNLLEYIVTNNPELIEATKYDNLKIDSFSKTHNIRNTNKETEDISGLIGSKTGYTSFAGGNLAVVFDASIGRPIVIVVMGSTQEGRFSDVKALVKASLEHIKRQ